MEFSLLAGLFAAYFSDDSEGTVFRAKIEAKENADKEKRRSESTVEIAREKYVMQTGKIIPLGAPQFGHQQAAKGRERERAASSSGDDSRRRALDGGAVAGREIRLEQNFLVCVLFGQSSQDVTVMCLCEGEASERKRERKGFSGFLEKHTVLPVFFIWSY